MIFVQRKGTPSSDQCEKHYRKLLLKVHPIDGSQKINHLTLIPEILSQDILPEVNRLVLFVQDVLSTFIVYHFFPPCISYWFV